MAPVFVLIIKIWYLKYSSYVRLRKKKKNKESKLNPESFMFDYLALIIMNYSNVLKAVTNNDDDITFT